ncbi:MAG: J domain-containing protein [Acidobacteriia bacterium]|nr:J domain-containing protein [Terriglobia bacterium]
MNYYEELGVSPGASAEEIRHAYKTLARLLHPDQFTDAAMNHLAELQMKRLNGILGLLCNPEERRRYNVQLQGPPAVRSVRPPERTVVPAPVERRWVRPWAIGLCAWLPPVAVVIAFFAALLYYGGGFREVLPAAALDTGQNSTSTAHGSARAAVAAAGPLAAAGPDEESLLARFNASQRDLQSLRAENLRMVEELAVRARPQSREPSIPEPPAAALQFAEPDVNPVTPLARMEPAMSERTGPAPSQFAGNWYYVPLPHPTAAKGTYLPQYIELRLAEGAGTVRGRYRALYRITDQAISPEVAFRFEGAGKIPVAQLAWTGPGESRGKVTLRLISRDRLEVSWIASQLSADLNLASGTAQLVRQREP